MLYLDISNNRRFELEFEEDNLQKFSICKLWYKDNNLRISMYEDYIYFFIDNMLGRLNAIPSLEKYELLGALGKWQEYFYFDSSYIKKHRNEIKQMENAIFISTELYGVFLYSFGKSIWLELDKGYNKKQCHTTVIDYYNNSSNYCILMTMISQKNLDRWKKDLEQLKNKLK